MQLTNPGVILFMYRSKERILMIKILSQGPVKITLSNKHADIRTERAGGCGGDRILDL